GKLAQLIVLALAPSGCDLIVIGKHRDRLSLAEQGGAAEVRLFAEREGIRDLDVVVEASGSPHGLSAAIEMTRPKGTVVLKSTHHAPTSLAMSRLVVDEMTIIGSRCGRFEPAIKFLESRRPDLSPLVSCRFELDEGVEAFNRAAEPGVLKVLFDVAS